MTEVHLHLARLPASGFDALLEAVGPELSEEEIAKARRFLFERDRVAYAASHSFLRRTLAQHLRCAPGAVQIVAAEHGRPELAGGGLRFNLSHTRGLVLVGVTERADIGVDCEEIERPLDVRSIAPDVLTPREREIWDGTAGSFFRSWTLKEAYVKARGVGLTLDLQSFSFTAASPPRVVVKNDDASAWQFHAFTPIDGYRAAAAVRSPDVRWIVHPSS